MTSCWCVPCSNGTLEKGTPPCGRGVCVCVSVNSCVVFKERGTAGWLTTGIAITPDNQSVTLKMEIHENWSAKKPYSGLPGFPDESRRAIVVPQTQEMAAVVLRIRDSGPGFAQEHLPRLGERFYKILGQKSPGKRGTGLGLAIVKHITRRHRGGLYIESSEGVGTIFTVVLPLRLK